MNRTLFAWMQLAGGSACTAAPQQLSREPAASYAFCNVFTSSACFGIAPGDRLTMEIPADFVMYSVEFASGSTAKVCVGGNPSLATSAEMPLGTCYEKSGFVECRVRTLTDGTTEYLVRGGSQSDFVHVTISANASPSSTTSFLNNIRACSKQGATLVGPSDRQRR